MTSLQAPELEPIGRIGRFSILAELPSGGMARVFLSKKDGAGNLCVLKQLHVELEKHPTAATRLKREAHLVSHLNHPNIARIVDAGVEDGKFCTATEFIAGRMLETIMSALEREGSILPPAISVFIAAQILEGLEHAHNLTDPEGLPLKIVHRDLSPRNIMVGYHGEVKIIDFGVAQGKIDDFKTAPGMMVGTLRYMAPEQALTRPTDQRTDLYTIAVVLYEMLTGLPVVREGKAVQVLTSVIEQMPTPAHVENPILPRALGEVVAKGLAKNPDDRWQTAREFREAVIEASRSLSRSTREHLGRLVRELFPSEAKQAEAFASLAQRLRTYELEQESGKETRGAAPATGQSRTVPGAVGHETTQGRTFGDKTQPDIEDLRGDVATDDLPILPDRYFAALNKQDGEAQETGFALSEEDAPSRWDDPTTKSAAVEPEQAVVASSSDNIGLGHNEGPDESTPLGLARPGDSDEEELYGEAASNEATPMGGHMGYREDGLVADDAGDAPTRIGIRALTSSQIGSFHGSYDAGAFAATSPSWNAGGELVAPQFPSTSDPAVDADNCTRTTLPMMPPAEDLATPADTLLATRTRSGTAEHISPLVEIFRGGQPDEPNERSAFGEPSAAQAQESLEQELESLKQTTRTLRALVVGLLAFAGILIVVMIYVLVASPFSASIIP